MNSTSFWKIGLMVSLPCLMVIVIGARQASAQSAQSDELWAGHQVVFGETDVPVLGKRETRSDSYLLARVTRRDGNIEIEQIACKVAFKEVLGAKVSIPTDALLRLPAAKFRFSPVDNLMKAEPWSVGWSKQDVDKDSNPGLTVDVDASMCSGKLYVASDTRSAAVGKMLDNDTGMMGKISVRVKQKILGTNSACLKLFSSDSDETQNGGFIYRRVPDGSTCEELLKHPWPIQATIKR
jgi:hypothetical protein